jgi:hypothetical protein
MPATTQLSALDDRFHHGTTKDGSWTETSWFAAQIPERDLCLWVYPLWRQELGVMSCGVYLWDSGGDEIWQLPYQRNWWHLPIPDDCTPTDFSLSTGLAYECLEPLRRYRITYQDGDELSVDMEFTGVHPARAVGVVPGRHGHIDQFGHVVGELTLRGDRMEIDCIEMRDRTWSARRESRQGAHVCYSYGASKDGHGFHVSHAMSASAGEYRLLGGFVLRPGGEVDVVHATHTIRRDLDGRPVAVAIDLDLADGTTFTTRGEVVSRLAMPATPWFSWDSTVRWDIGGETVYGEYQDVWGLGYLRSHLRPNPNQVTIAEG